MTYRELLALARALEGKQLHTPTGRQFTVGVYLDCPFFTPASTGRGRSDGRKAAERFLDRYNRTGSLRPVDLRGRHAQRLVLHRHARRGKLLGRHLSRCGDPVVRDASADR